MVGLAYCDLDWLALGLPLVWLDMGRFKLSPQNRQGPYQTSPGHLLVPWPWFEVGLAYCYLDWLALGLALVWLDMVALSYHPKTDKGHTRLANDFVFFFFFGNRSKPRRAK